MLKNNDNFILTKTILIIQLKNQKILWDTVSLNHLRKYATNGTLPLLKPMINYYAKLNYY